MMTLYELYKELIYIRDQITDLEIPITVDGKEIKSVELLTNPLRVEIKLHETNSINIVDEHFDELI